MTGLEGRVIMKKKRDNYEDQNKLIEKINQSSLNNKQEALSILEITGIIGDAQASLRIIIQAFKRLASLVHPTNNPKNKEKAKQAFKKLCDAKFFAESGKVPEFFTNFNEYAKDYLFVVQGEKANIDEKAEQALLSTWARVSESRKGQAKTNEVRKNLNHLPLGNDAVADDDLEDLIGCVDYIFPDDYTKTPAPYKNSSQDSRVNYLLLKISLDNRYDFAQLHKTYQKPLKKTETNTLPPTSTYFESMLEWAAALGNVIGRFISRTLVDFIDSWNIKDNEATNSNEGIKPLEQEEVSDSNRGRKKSSYANSSLQAFYPNNSINACPNKDNRPASSPRKKHRCPNPTPQKQSFKPLTKEQPTKEKGIRQRDYVPKSRYA